MGFKHKTRLLKVTLGRNSVLVGFGFNMRPDLPQLWVQLRKCKPKYVSLLWCGLGAMTLSFGILVEVLGVEMTVGASSFTCCLGTTLPEHTQWGGDLLHLAYHVCNLSESVNVGSILLGLV